MPRMRTHPNVTQVDGPMARADDPARNVLCGQIGARRAVLGEQPGPATSRGSLLPERQVMAADIRRSSTFHPKSLGAPAPTVRRERPPGGGRPNTAMVALGPNRSSPRGQGRIKLDVRPDYRQLIRRGFHRARIRSGTRGRTRHWPRAAQQSVHLDPVAHARGQSRWWVESCSQSASSPARRQTSYACLPGGYLDMCFLAATASNRTLTVDFDHCHARFANPSEPRLPAMDGPSITGIKWPIRRA